MCWTNSNSWQKASGKIVLLAWHPSAPILAANILISQKMCREAKYFWVYWYWCCSLLTARISLIWPGNVSQSKMFSVTSLSLADRYIRLIFQKTKSQQDKITEWQVSFNASCQHGYKGEVMVVTCKYIERGMLTYRHESLLRYLNISETSITFRKVNPGIDIIVQVKSIWMICL